MPLPIEPEKVDNTSVPPAMMNQVLTSWLLATSPFSMRIVETFLRRVFCFVVGIVGHRGVLAFC